MDTTQEIKTFRGRSLEELLPQVRSELGPDAIVIRRREGLAGGVAGFFQRSYVELDARPALPDEKPLEIRSDRATTEGLSTPGIQALVSQAAPFADALAAVMPQAPFAPPEPEPEPELAPEPEVAPEPSVPPARANLYGPQPNFEAIMAEAVQAAATPAPVVEAPAFEPEPEPEVVAVEAEAVEPEPVAVEPEPVAVESEPVPAPAAAAALVASLTGSGLSSTLSAAIVAEAAAHGLPFGGDLETHVRAAVAGRVHVLSHLGTGARRAAFVGPGGAGKSSAIVHLARAYADADAAVVVVALRSPDGGRRLANELEPHGVTVIAAADAEQALRRLARHDAQLTLIDTPATGIGDEPAGLGADLEALGATEVHLALPATISAAAADELHSALKPLGITHLVLTHADATARPGAPIEVAMTTRTPLSYVCGRDGAETAEPAGLSRRLLP
jgi:flagellar biosynthesis GTPase FlhF